MTIQNPEKKFPALCGSGAAGVLNGKKFCSLHANPARAAELGRRGGRRRTVYKLEHCVAPGTSVTSFDVDSGVIYGLAHLPPNFVDPTLRSVVAPTDFLFGMARMFQIAGSDTRRGLLIVRTLKEALTRLDIKDTHFRTH